VCSSDLPAPPVSHAHAQHDPDRPLAGPSTNDANSEELRTRLEARLARIEQEKTRIEQDLRDLDAGKEIEHRGEKRRGPWRDRPSEGRRGGNKDDRPLTDEERETVLEFFRKHDPQMLERHKAFAERNQERAQHMFDRRGRHILSLLELEQEDPERFELRLRAIKAHGKIREVITEAIRGEALDAPETRKELAKLVAYRIDDQDSEREQEISDLESRVEQLRSERVSNRERRNERIEHAIDRILAKAREFRDAPPEPSEHLPRRRQGHSPRERTPEQD